MIKKRTFYTRECIDVDYDINGNPVYKYGDVQVCKGSLNSVSGSYEIAVYGDRVKNMQQTILDYHYKDVIHEGDLAYLFGANPNDEKEIGTKANYNVVAVLPQNLKVKILMEKLP